MKSQVETYTDVSKASNEYYTMVNNAEIATDCYESPTMVANTVLTVDVGEDDLEIPFSDVAAESGYTLTDVRWYDEDGNVVGNKIR